MNFLPTKLNITEYKQSLSDKLKDENCHVFIDTNILSQLYKLNDKARAEFFEWVESIESRFHIPNWVVMEYNNRVKSKQLKDYVSEIDKIKSVGKELINLQRFSWGYVDDDILQGSTYHEDVQKFQDDFSHIVEMYNCISKVIKEKLSDRLIKVEQEVIDKFSNYVVDTDIYTIIQNVQQSAAIRFENRIPPGYGDNHKDTNRFGDLVIWQELLDCCKRNNWTKAILISRDFKDQYFKPDIQQIDGFKIQEEDKIGIAHESLVYEFKLVTGNDDFLLIDFITLVQLLSKKYTELAFSFQMVSHVTTDATEERDNGLDQISREIPDENIQRPVHAGEPEGEAATSEYIMEAIHDRLYMEKCDNDELKNCIMDLRSHNWYIQNNAVESFVIFAKNCNETDENKNNFFVIGRNILQSAEGNAFEAVRFIRNMSKILESKSSLLKKAIIDGCLYEIFFNSYGELRKKGFKGRYFSDVVENAKECLGNDAFTFINDELSKVTDHFVPLVDRDLDYNFKFEICLNEDTYYTQSLTINDLDCSDSFCQLYPTEFANKDDITHSLSIYYAIPENKIHITGIPEDLTSLRFIRRENNNQ